MHNSENIFSTILASTVHDMKNSLGMMLEALDSLLDKLEDSKTDPKYGIVQYESMRVNNSLMQLLALYKIENNQLPFNPSYHNVYDFIEEQILIHEPLLKAKGFNYTIDVDEDIEAVFDESLISMVVSNIIGNAIRYAHSEIRVSAEIDERLSIIINDDGPGYPAQMIELVGDYMLGINQSTGSTGLGLFFAQKVAELHSHGEKSGSIELANGGKLGGGAFLINIP
ncbi:HAMP domain-containing histidine kinase [Aliikangiella marina]|uniref:histidine kinase n=1 Tax=Aliikangiella marina TaxID=1712262 RepID=A0A545T2K7_9GAMM|nr:HAMP domain-containing sensor histidine kinase [Aliikangiella marina]TQV71439.1 HAMP domain-containing histidine kinase [Aliikangiella marina]